MPPRDDEGRRAREAQYLTDLRTPKEPFGIAAGSIRTGHDDASITHPAWCSPNECTVASPNYAHHLSEWTIVYPSHDGEAAIFVRLFADAMDSAEEPPGVEICLMRPGQASSLEGYELRGAQARHLGQALRGHASVVGDPHHWDRPVTL
ncbi:hypothetical protein [Dactylosporangium sp. CA-139066]|uniref:hypothetical protein n=1 Tax=Dactylosporangium sp. CA-139066 TaxID=3239930 RepID=UPI003D907144